MRSCWGCGLIWRPARARLDAQVLAATREVDGRGAAVATGAASTAAWLRHKLLLHPAAAKAEVALAKDLAGELTATGQALRTGEVTRDQAAAVATAMRALPGAVDPATRRRAEAWMLAEAAQFDVAAMHKLGRHLVQVVDPERGAALERDEARHAARQELTLTHGADGSRRFRGHLGPEGGALLDAALAAVSGPRPAQDGTPDPRTPGQRRAEGLLELIALATQTDGMPEHGGEPVTLTVITTRDYLAQARDHHDHCDGSATRTRSVTTTATTTATTAAGPGAGSPGRTATRTRSCRRRPWRTAPRSRRSPSVGWAATRGWSRPSSTPTSTCWTSAGSAGSSPARCAAP